MNAWTAFGLGFGGGIVFTLALFASIGLYWFFREEDEDDLWPEA